MKGSLACIHALLESGSAVDATTVLGVTPLYAAAQERQPEAMRALIAAGANVEHRIINGATCIVAAAKGGSVECLQILLDGGADVSADVAADGSTALMLAAQERHSAFVKALLQAGASPNTRNKMGGTAAMFAAQSGSPECLKAILDAGGDPNMVGFNLQIGALHSAAQQGHLACVQLLLDRGADCNAISPAGETPLSEAAKGGHELVVRALLQAGAATESEMNTRLARAVAEARSADLPPGRALMAAFSRGRGNGPTAPICEAAARGHLGCVRALLEASADIEVVASPLAITPLIAASFTGHADFVKLLLEAGASTAPKNLIGMSALAGALHRGYTDCAELLRAAGAREPSE
ncbi:ankyrin repeat [Chlorella sorokiniana]|uniref:Ankyrin repeat n=1 Tax=Chlorella sorokiniana TaxID=3076 RepID=A0A2P6TDJ3_CHLSO|nr:ankyrin repeat [Chlorella sorokiniana]|eukprot:PRW20701.1 ankyrin repeat [Chlorella sorokiniana]